MLIKSESHSGFCNAFCKYGLMKYYKQTGAGESRNKMASMLASKKPVGTLDIANTGKTITANNGARR